MATKMDDPKAEQKPKINKKEMEALDELFANGVLASEYSVKSIRRAAEELVVFAKKRNMTLDKLAAISRQQLGDLYFRELQSKMLVINHITAVWGRTHGRKR